jgi:nicotinamide mononucleotide transporter
MWPPIPDLGVEAIWENIWRGLTEAAPLDQANLALGLLGVGLMIRRSRWAFPVGLVAVIVQGLLFWRARFYADAVLQGFFFACLTYGWRHWRRDSAQKNEPVAVTWLAPRSRVGWLATGLALTLGWGAWQQTHTDAVMPYRDAFIAAFSLVGQILQVRKHLENWIVWLVVNTVAIAAYWSADLAYTAFLYALYLLLAALGLRAWRQALVKNPQTTP